MAGGLSTQALGFALFAAVMSATPGPNNTMLATSGANVGFRRTIPHMAGVALGYPAMLLLVALGAGEILRSAPVVQTVLRWGGILYLLWMAWHIAAAPVGPIAGARMRPMTMAQAALFQWVNPKAWLITVGAVATYTDPAFSTLIQATLLALIALAVTVPSVAVWTALGSGAASLLRTPRHLRWFNCVMAALLVLSLIPVLLEG